MAGVIEKLLVWRSSVIRQSACLTR